MTIHSDWSRILHEECSEAFSSRAPRCSLGIGIIDGHLQLMRLDERMRTWECFIRNQFLKPIQTLFHLGCPRVVLCFDNYHAVPIYKSMTQVLRSSRHQEVRVFDPEDALPSAVPDEPMLYLMNRNFKLRLIEMLCERIPSMVELQAGQELILDYKRVVRYTPGCRVPVLMPGMESMGESDVKFCRYVSRFGNALVHAIDGDYMAIALLYYTQHPKRLDNQIFIYRQLSVLQSTSSTQSAKKKRRLAQTSATEDMTLFKVSEKQVPKCWVNMQLVYMVITKAMRQSKYHEIINPSTSLCYSDQDAVFSIVFLMLCAGTDFSRNIPLLGPKRMWEALPCICAPLLQAVTRAEGLNECLFLNLVVGRMYALNYRKHVGAQRHLTLEGVLESLHQSKLSDVTKEKLPTQERMRTTLRNLQWVIKYWSTENGAVETPEDGRYGYARNIKGDLTFVDLCP